MIEFHHQIHHAPVL